ncbi:hypothetical protein EJB05_06556, partial [Eragrostis curvula]
MEKGKGLARRWAVELHDGSSSSSGPTVPDPPGSPDPPPTRYTPLLILHATGFLQGWILEAGIHMVSLLMQDDAAGARQRKDSETAWKAQVRSIDHPLALLFQKI